MRSPPEVSRTEDVRETARLMVESDLKLLPVYEGTQLYGVVTARSLLGMVRENLGALSVGDVCTRDLVSVDPDTTLGTVIHLLRTRKISRVPVVDDDDAVGMISLLDLIDFTTRAMDREQGGQPDGFDNHGGTGSRSGYNTHGGYGERAGDEDRMLDLPARDLMTSPARTVPIDAGLDDAYGRMADAEYNSLVVTAEEMGASVGIVTTTDLLRALTWTPEPQLPVQVFGVDLMDDLRREAVADRIEEIDAKYGEMDVIEANVVFHEHDERLRGTPLLLATIRLFTDRGRFSGSGEGYGARAAFGEASDVVEENVLESKERTDPRNIAEHERQRAAELLDWWGLE